MKTAIIWRKSVYDTNRCSHCGKRLIDNENQPVNVAQGKVGGKDALFCESCGTTVAWVEPYTGNLNPGERGGRWKGE